MRTTEEQRQSAFDYYYQPKALNQIFRNYIQTGKILEYDTAVEELESMAQFLAERDARLKQ